MGLSYYKAITGYRQLCTQSPTLSISQTGHQSPPHISLSIYLLGLISFIFHEIFQQFSDKKLHFVNII